MTSTTNGTATQTRLQPYIFFYGRCQEALEFYKTALGGTYEIMFVKDTPVAEQMPPGFGDKVMHASFSAPGIEFMASDGRELKSIDPDAGNISIGLTIDDSDKGERILAALSAGGKITMPLDAAFWGGRFASFVDRFGVEWLLTLP